MRKAISNKEKTPQTQLQKQQYAEYLEKMQKDIHDEKMKRFIDQTQKLNEICPESPPPRREIKRVDTGLRPENRQVDLEFRVSISPERKRSLSKGFVVKPAEINHFTGKRKSVGTVELEVNRDLTKGFEDPELYV